MKHYDVRCPFCGTLNKDLLLDETEGSLECERCERLVCVNYKHQKPVMSTEKNWVKICLA